MMKIKNLTLLSIGILAAIVSGINPVSANPIADVFVNDPRCDAPQPRQLAEELGTDVFPVDELISVITTPTSVVECNGTPGGNDDWEVSMTNETTEDFGNLYFISDQLPVGNADGTVTGQDAFKIDTVGVNTPLVSESIASDEIFQAGETWVFLVSDFAEEPIFGSLGISSASLSSNANIATGVPEPTTMLATLLVFGTGSLLKGKMKKK